MLFRSVEIGLLTPPFGIACFVIKATLGNQSRITLNEIVCFTLLAYGTGTKAPGRKESDKIVNQTYHHALLCHGHGVRARAYLGKQFVNALARGDAGDFERLVSFDFQLSRVLLGRDALGEASGRGGCGAVVREGAESAQEPRAA